MTLQNKMIFCTLFDSNYLDKGLALYQSMRKHIVDFKLYIFAFDDKCFEILSDMQLEHVILCSQKDILNTRLLKIKEERTKAEFCWTCTSIIIEYVLLKCKEKICTYIDADIYFFSSPENAIQEIIDAGCSVGLVEHRFERNSLYGQNIFRVGKYCIQFNTFLNNKEGLLVLKDWKEKCLDWCYDRYEDGKFGDQKYSDKWKQKYSCIHEIQNLGVGVAPWNIHLYTYIGVKGQEIWMEYRRKRFQLVFYHFENIKYLKDGYVYLNLWKSCVPGTAAKRRILYGIYLRHIERVRRYLDTMYGFTFEHMMIDRDDFFEKRNSLKELCVRDGLVDGLNIWMGYWNNNVIKVKRYVTKKKDRKHVYTRKNKRYK